MNGLSDTRAHHPFIHQSTHPYFDPCVSQLNTLLKIQKALRETQSALWGSRKLLGAEDRVLRGLRDAELHDALGFDLDRFASGGIAAHACLAVDQHELAETGQRESILGVLVRELRDELQDFSSGLLGDAGFGCDFGCDL
jgi:hypothetical protein